MSAILVVIDIVDKSILLAVKAASLVGEEEFSASVAGEYLPGKCFLLVDAEAAVKPSELVVAVNKPVICPQEPDKGIRLADIACQ